jgi:hypothetical protein
MSSYKKLSKADVTTVNYHANKYWTFSYNNAVNNSSITSYKGKNESFNITGSTTVNGQYQSLIYSEINHLFYQAYTASLNTGSLMFNVDTYISASQQRPTSSYFNYNDNPLLIKQFPTGVAETIVVLSINQDIYGSKVLPYSFEFSSSASLIRDDGYGNLYNVAGAENQYIDLSYVTLAYFDSGSILPIGVEFVGNMFYAHGLAVITNQSSSYQNIIPTVIGQNCDLYTFTNGKISTTYQYITCSGALVTETLPTLTLSVDRCIDALYGVNIISGNGGADYVSDCAGNVNPKVISFQNEHIIYENEVRCIVRESDYNLTYNPTILQYGGQYIALSGSATPSGSIYTLTGSFDSTVKDFATGSVFQPYVTTIGLYNDDNELLMVAKLGKPIMLSPDTDMTFIVRYDT